MGGEEEEQEQGKGGGGEKEEEEQVGQDGAEGREGLEEEVAVARMCLRLPHLTPGSKRTRGATSCSSDSRCSSSVIIHLFSFFSSLPSFPPFPRQ
jgi:hypothetical protein